MTAEGHARSNLTVPIEIPWVLHISPPGVQPGICHRFRDISSQNFDGWPFDLERANPWAKGHQKRRWPTIHLDLPFYRISAQARKRSARYVLLKFFTFWLRGQPLGQSSLKGEMTCWTPSSTILPNFITLRQPRQEISLTKNPADTHTHTNKQ